MQVMLLKPYECIPFPLSSQEIQDSLEHDRSGQREGSVRWNSVIHRAAWRILTKGEF